MQSLLACKDFVVFVVYIVQLSKCNQNIDSIECWLWVTISIPRNRWPFRDHGILVVIFLFTMLNLTWELLASLFKRDWNCWSSSFNLNFDFNFVFCIGMTAVKSSLILTLIFLLIGHFRFFFMAYFLVSLQRDWNCVGKQFHFEFWLGLFDVIFGWTQSNPFANNLLFCCKFYPAF